MFSDSLFAKKDLSASKGRVSPERKQWVRKESAIILAKNLAARERAKEEMFEKRKEKVLIAEAVKEERVVTWQKKTKQSPFAVDLVAESERVYEETLIRTQEEEERKAKINTRRNKAKNDIILKALSEFSDLEALRRERRAILEEEQRLKALLALEKVTVDRKSERIAAENAQRQRHYEKTQQRRLQYKDSLDSILAEEAIALKKKNAIPLSPPPEFRVPVLK